jgi:hypothetical protein
VEPALRQLGVRCLEDGDRLPERGSEPRAAAGEVREGERVGHHADDRRPHAVDLECPPNDGRVSAEAPLEQLPGDDGHVRRAQLLLIRREGAADGWAGAHELEESGRDIGGNPSLRTIAAWQRDTVATDERDPVDRVRGRRGLLLPVPERWIGRDAQAAVVAALVHRAEPVGLAVGQSAQDDRIDDAEDRGDAADPECQHEHDDEREARRSRERPPGIAELLICSVQQAYLLRTN